MSLAIRDITAEPGQKIYTSLKCGEWADGSAVSIPLCMASGANPGPSLLVLACLHGDEVVGTEALRRVMAELDPTEMSGSVIAVFAANVPAFLAGARVNILEHPAGSNDMNRLWRTAQPTGSMTERLACAIRDEIIPQCEYYIDLHSSAQGSVNYPRAIVAGEHLDLASDLREKIDNLAEYSNFEYVFKPSGGQWKGMYFAPSSPFVEDYGKAGIVLETGYAPTPNGANELADGIRNIATGLGITKGQVERTVQLKFIERLIAVRANRGGMWQPTALLGQAVSKGDALGEIVDFSGAVLETLTAPESGVVIKVATTATITTGVRADVLGVLYE